MEQLKKEDRNKQATGPAKGESRVMVVRILFCSGEVRRPGSAPRRPSAKRGVPVAQGGSAAGHRTHHVLDRDHEKKF